ncbi:ribosomal protein S18-alanine N-acetyltransferase [Maricaulis sp. CAU 1757]
MTRVRPATSEDLDRIDQIEAASFTADRFPRRNLRRMLLAGRTRFVVADADRGLGGYAALSLRRGSTVARLYSLAIDPASRRQGIGQALLAACRDIARKAGRTCLSLEVRASNKAAISLYQGAGFCLREERKAYYEDGETAWVMQLDLADVSTQSKKETP